jgi:hypothetical protein
MLLIPASLFAQQLVYQFSRDTSQYDNGYIYSYVIQCPGLYQPDPNSNVNAKYYSSLAWNTALKKKNSIQWDIYSLNGKIGSATVDTSVVPTDWHIMSILFSQTIIDSDEGWEYILNMQRYNPQTMLYSGAKFLVIDDNGTQLLSDTLYAYYGYDLQNTYVYSSFGIGPYKVWKFRSNVSAISPSLAKSSGTGSLPIMSLMPSGDFRIQLIPSGNGQTLIQLIDMAGRLHFSRSIRNTGRPTSFTIPSGSVPNSPFLFKANNGKDVFLKETIPFK